MILEARIKVLRELLDSDYVSMKHGVAFDAIPIELIQKMLDEALEELAERDKSNKFKGVF